MATTPELYSDVPELFEEAQMLAKRRKIAEAMQAKALEQQTPFRMAGKVAVPMHFMQGLGQLANAWVAKDDLNKADTDQKDLYNKRQDIINAEIERINTIRSGSPGAPAIPTPSAADGGGPGRPEIPATPPGTREQITQEMLKSRYRPFREQAISLMQKQTESDMQADQFRSALQAAGIGGTAPTGQSAPAVPQAASQPTPQINPQTGLTPEQQNYASSLKGPDQEAYVNAARLSNKGQAANFGTDAPNVNKVASLNLPNVPTAATPNGVTTPTAPAAAAPQPSTPKLPVSPLLLSPNKQVQEIGKIIQDANDKRELQQERLEDRRVAREQSEALRRDLAEQRAADVKAKAEEKANEKRAKVDEGRETVSTLVSNLRQYYTDLNKAGGITNAENGALDNFVASSGASPIGQVMGRTFGTENQKIRDTISQQRPLLLNAIKEATGMSAQQMNSNAELNLYLSAATDPSKDIKANLDALDMLDKLYGLKIGGNANPPGNSPSLPAGIPAGSKVVGKTPDGKKDVYQSPDGKKWVQ